MPELKGLDAFLTANGWERYGQRADGRWFYRHPDVPGAGLIDELAFFKTAFLRVQEADVRMKMYVMSQVNEVKGVF